jgi:hypothetical protein
MQEMLLNTVAICGPLGKKEMELSVVGRMGAFDSPSTRVPVHTSHTCNDSSWE